jgi:hypothetical protein
MFWFSPIFALLVLIPAVRLLRRGGHSPWSALLLLIPLVNIAFIWWLAFGRGAERSGHDSYRNHWGTHRQHESQADAPVSTA